MGCFLFREKRHKNFMCLLVLVLVVGEVVLCFSLFLLGSKTQMRKVNFKKDLVILLLKTRPDVKI